MHLSECLDICWRTNEEQSAERQAIGPTLLMNFNSETIESNLRLHVDRLAGLIGSRTLKRPKTIQATIGYITGRWNEIGHSIRNESYDALGDEATNLVVEKLGTKRASDVVLLGDQYDNGISEKAPSYHSD